MTAVTGIAATLAWLAAPAPASTTVGSSLQQRADLYVRCDATCTEAQTARPGGLAVAATVDGVITGWRVRAATQGTVRLRVLRPQPGGTFKDVGSTAPQALNQPRAPGKDVLYTFTARVGVRAGDRIALDRDRGAGGVFHSYAQNTSYGVTTFTPKVPDDGAAAPSSAAIGRELLLNADIEKDGDVDGFGDETQDTCPAAATVGPDGEEIPCPTRPVTPPGAGTGSGPGAAAPPDGVSTATPVGGPAAGGDGPPVSGERKSDRNNRGHRRRPSGRPAPPAARREDRGHRSRPAPRRGPAAAPRRENGNHGRRKPPRTAPSRAPKSADRDHARRKAPRRAPRRESTRTSEPHRSRPGARNAPAKVPQDTSARHRGRSPRPAPPEGRPDPGFRPHRS